MSAKKKAAVTEEVVAEATEVKEEVKAAAKKPAAKKTAKAKEPKVNVVVEFLGKNVNVDDLVEAAKEDYKARGNTEEIESVDVYYQPEYNKFYYLVNGKAQENPVEV